MERAGQLIINFLKAVYQIFIETTITKFPVIDCVIIAVIVGSFWWLTKNMKHINQSHRYSFISVLAAIFIMLRFKFEDNQYAEILGSLVSGLIAFGLFYFGQIYEQTKLEQERQFHKDEREKDRIHAEEQPEREKKKFLIDCLEEVRKLFIEYEKRFKEAVEENKKSPGDFNRIKTKHTLSIDYCELIREMKFGIERRYPGDPKVSSITKYFSDLERIIPEKIGQDFLRADHGNNWPAHKQDGLREFINKVLGEINELIESITEKSRCVKLHS